MKLSELKARVLKNPAVISALDAQQAVLPPKQGVSTEDVRQALEIFVDTLAMAMSDVVHSVTDTSRDFEIPNESKVIIEPADFSFIKGLDKLTGNARLVRMRCHFIQECTSTFAKSMFLFTQAKDAEKRLRDLATVVVPVAASIRGIKMKPEYMEAANPRK